MIKAPILTRRFGLSHWNTSQVVGGRGSKDPRFVKDMAVDMVKAQSQFAWDKSGRPDLLNAEEGYLVVHLEVGSNHSAASCGGGGSPLADLIGPSAHFGHSGEVRSYYRHLPSFRYVRVMTPNPKFADGVKNLQLDNYFDTSPTSQPFYGPDKPIEFGSLNRDPLFDRFRLLEDRVDPHLSLLEDLLFPHLNPRLGGMTEHLCVARA